MIFDRDTDSDFVTKLPAKYRESNFYKMDVFSENKPSDSFFSSNFYTIA